MIRLPTFSPKTPHHLLRCVLVGVLSLYFLDTLLILQHSCQREGDLALIALNVIDAMQGKHLVGAYSRYHFSHPGPILFYLYGLGSFLFFWMDSFAGKLLSTQELLNIAALATIACIQNSGKKDWSSGILLAAAVFFSLHVAHPRGFEQIWNPIALLCPLAAYLVLVSRLSPDRAWRLPVTLMLAACLVQIHIGTVAILAPTLGYALARHVVDHGLLPTLRSVGIGLIISSALLAPVLYDAVQGPHFGNLGAIVAFLSAHHEKHAAAEILTVIEELYYYPRAGSALVAIIALAPLYARRCRATLPVMQFDILALAQFGMYLSAANTYGPLYQYLLWSHVIISALCVGEILGQITSTHAFAHELLAGALLIATVATYLPYGPEYCGDSDRTNTMVEKIVPYPAPYCLDISANEQFGPAALVALRLEQLGSRVFVPRPWATHFGKNHSPGCTSAASVIRFSNNPDTNAAPETLVYETPDSIVTILSSAEWRLHRRRT